MQTLERKSFSAAYDAFRADEDDRLLHALVLTYEFDAPQMLAFTQGSRDLAEERRQRVSHREDIARIRPLVVYDASKTGEFMNIPHFLELQPWKNAPFTCHHSKAYCLVTAERVFLALGSFNLTRTGLFENRELMEIFDWPADIPRTGHILRQWLDFLRQAYQSRIQASEQSALNSIANAIEERIERWTPPVTGDGVLLHSGYGLSQSGGLMRLREIWNEWYPGLEPTALFAVSPFFDQGGEYLADEFLEAFPSIAELTLVTDESRLPYLGARHFGPIERSAKKRLYLIPEEVGPEELAAIAEQAKERGVSIKDRVFRRKLHAKMLILRNGPVGIGYLGSANFTLKAWKSSGGNRELGLAWKETDAEAICLEAQKHLFVDAKVNQYDPSRILHEKNQTSEWDDNYADFGTDYPDMIRSIVLEPIANGDGNAYFRLLLADPESEERCTLTPEEYDVFWDNLPLRFKDGVSGEISAEEWRKRLRMMHCRTLTFIPRGTKPVRKHWLPFQYADGIITERESLIWPSALDWIQHFLNPERDDGGVSGIPVPGEELEEQEGDDGNGREHVDREGNQVIAMQRYLSGFARFEQSLFREAAALAVDYGGYWNSKDKLKVRDPVVSFCKLLLGEWDLDKARAKTKAAAGLFPKHVFRVGEALLLLRDLQARRQERKVDLASMDAALCERLQTEWAASVKSGNPEARDAAVNRYIEFVTSHPGQANRPLPKPEASA